MPEQKIVLKTALMPGYYRNFRCLAADCQDDCCHGWRIEFDKKDYLAMRREDAPAAFKERLDRTVRRNRGEAAKRMYARFEMGEGNRCPMQDPDGLCSLQKTCGHAALPQVCQSYPRKEENTPAAKELSLSPSCEGVLALLWDLPDGVDFIEESLPQAEWKTFIFRGLNPAFPTVRALCVDVLQARQLPLPKRMILLGIVLQDLMRLDWDAPDLAGWAARVEMRLGDPQTAALLEQLPANRSLFLSQNLAATLRMRNADLLRASASALNVDFMPVDGTRVGWKRTMTPNATSGPAPP